MIDKLSSRTARFLIDGLITACALYLAYLARYDGAIPAYQQRQFLILVVPVVLGRLLAQFIFGLHKHKWRYLSILDVIRICQVYAGFSFVLLGLRLALPSWQTLDIVRLPIGVIAMEFVMSLLGTLSIRGLRRIIDRRANRESGEASGRRILLAGAGIHGITVANEMVLSPGMRVVGFVDDDPHKVGSVIAGVPVLGPISSLSQQVKKLKVDEVLICIPPSGRDKLSAEIPRDLSVRTRIIPTMDEILSADGDLLSFEGIQSGPAPRRSSYSTGSAINGYPQTSLRDRTILITGGAGFIGSNLAEILAKDNQVVLLDVAFRGKPVEFTGLLRHPNVRAVEGSLLEGSHIQTLCQEADMVVHAAALVGVSRVCNAGRETLETNYVGTSRLLQALEGSKRLERLIYFSTSEVFGVNSFRVDENSAPSVGPIAEARWSYAIAKLAGEHLVKAYFRETGMPISIVRPFNVFGPKRTGEHAMLRFIVNALAGKSVEIHGDGSQIRSWCYIDDFCSALVRMLERREAIGEDFNIGNASNTLNILDLARKVVDLCGAPDTRIKFIDHPFPDISIRVPSLAKAQSLLGYKPRYDLDSALRLTIDWYREHLDFFVKDERLAAAARG
ncbi:MAG: NAD-dependent epimerase/dehydratase family protein [Acidobacteriaceae bacterium]|nr:NAD-dependent epimerase/dehydratase family protein [Acidobacteriaceae bacterium]MBV9765041.1 NAD-dependent epimerase/dehydratase family protein [Acidobacteriaceae bacterium]